MHYIFPIVVIVFIEWPHVGPHSRYVKSLSAVYCTELSEWVWQMVRPELIPEFKITINKLIQIKHDINVLNIKKNW